jgi:tripartite-type tricarboxylate transporter receptor subunit TctC
LAVFALLLGQSALAQDFPERPVRLIVPFAAGGGTDLSARAVAQKMTEAWGQPVLVENRPGGTGIVGTEAVAKSDADGYTLLLASASSHVIMPLFQSELPYDPAADFASVSLIAAGPQVMAVNSSASATSVAELVEYSKAHPTEVNYGHSGVGSVSYVAAELFKAETGAVMESITYKGAGAAVTDLLGNQIQVMFTGPNTVIPHVVAGKLKALAVASETRVPGLDDVPTFAEAGYPTVVASNWFGILVPAGTPTPVIDKLNAEIVRIVALPEIQELFQNAGYQAVSTSVAEFDQLIADDSAKWKKVVSGLTP